MRRGRVYSIEEYTWEVENSGDRIIGVMEAEVKTVEALKEKRKKKNENKIILFINGKKIMILLLI